MTKEQLIKEFDEKFDETFYRSDTKGALYDTAQDIKAFLLSAFDAGEKNGIVIGRASGIEEVQKKMERTVKKIEITEGEPPFYQKKVNAYATQEARKTVRNFMKYIFSLTPFSSCENHTIYSESCVACQKSNELTPSSSKDN